MGRKMDMGLCAKSKAEQEERIMEIGSHRARMWVSRVEGKGGGKGFRRDIFGIGFPSSYASLLFHYFHFTVQC